MSITRGSLRADLIQRLKPEFGDQAQIEADALMRISLDTNDSFVLTANVTVPDACLQKLEQNFHQRVINRKPISRIKGVQSFWKHVFEINEHVLDPRPDTETLIEAVLVRFDANAPLHILDLGTGSGCILLSLLSEFPLANGIGVDVSEKALEIADKNCANLGLKERADFQVGSWKDEGAAYKSRRYDLIVCNPPYIDPSDKTWMQPDVLNHDPHLALFAEEHGLADYACLFPQLHQLLNEDGVAFFEHGFQQREALCLLAQENNLRLVSQHNDLGGNPRVLAFHVPR